MPMSPRLLRPLASGDPDAQRYIAAVQQADQQSLEPAVRKAINDFVVGCKQDGIWNAIKASCILAGARTLAGALVPLKGTAPTNNGPFVTGDYNRETGLVGNGSSKFLDTNRSTTDDGQDDFHMAVYQSAVASSTDNVFMTHIGAVDAGNIVAQIAEGFPSSVDFKIRRAKNSSLTGTIAKNATNNANGVQGVSRSASGSFVFRAGGTETTISATSAAIGSVDFYVLAQNTNGTAQNFSNARLAFYSIGESLSLSSLDARVSALITAIGAAI